MGMIGLFPRFIAAKWVGARHFHARGTDDGPHRRITTGVGQIIDERLAVDGHVHNVPVPLELDLGSRETTCQGQQCTDHQHCELSVPAAHG